MVSYMILGVIWASWLEYYTSIKLDAEWNYPTRIFQILTWPIQLIVFIVTFIRNL